MNIDINTRLQACERRNRRLARLLAVQFLIFAGILGAILAGCVTTATRAAAPPGGTLRLSDLVIVDPHGVERVRISGDVPDAVIDGKRVPRGESAAGVILYDATGQERGGYVTWAPSGNVGLTLDTRKQQVTLFVADPDSGSALQLWHGKDLIELRSDDDGSRLTAVKANSVAFQEPPVAMSAEACDAYRQARSKLSPQQIARECGRRFTVEACRSCLGE